jgi:integrase
VALDIRGSVFKTPTGYGIRWPEAGRRPQKTGFATKTEARRWFKQHVEQRLAGGAPSADLTFDEFCDLYLTRHTANVSATTIETLTDRLRPARAAFGRWELSELEHAVDDVAAWRAAIPAGSQYRLTSALRQTLGAAVRWRYIARNPAVEAGRNPQPRFPELQPFTVEQVDTLADELGEESGPLVVFAAETGLRTNEWTALERRDIDRAGRAVTVQRRFAKGRLTPYPKTARSRRRVPLTDRALAALDQLVPRIDTPLVFPAAEGGHIALDNWRTREWYPALDAAGIAKRGPYALRHTFATEALAAMPPLTTFELSRLMGTSLAMIDRTYGHLARDSEDSIRARLNARTGRGGVLVASSDAESGDE